MFQWKNAASFTHAAGFVSRPMQTYMNRGWIESNVDNIHSLVATPSPRKVKRASITEMPLKVTHDEHISNDSQRVSKI